MSVPKGTAGGDPSSCTEASRFHRLHDGRLPRWAGRRLLKGNWGLYVGFTALKAPVVRISPENFVGRSEIREIGAGRDQGAWKSSAAGTTVKLRSLIFWPGIIENLVRPMTRGHEVQMEPKQMKGPASG